MIRVCSTTTDDTYATTGDVMMLLYGATTTAMVNTTGEINYAGTLARRATAWAERFLGYPLGLQVYSESLPAYGGRTLMLSRTPLRAILRLFDSTATSQGNEYTSSEWIIDDADAGLLARDQGFEWTEPQRLAVGDFNLGLTAYLQTGMEKRSWLVEYIAGYAPLGGIEATSCLFTTCVGAITTSTGSTIPDDIRQAIAMKAAEFQANPLGVAARRVGDLSVDYRSAGESAAEVMLTPYRRLA